MRPALTEPIFGSTKRTSRTRAILTQAGGSATTCTSSIFPDASSFFSFALAVRTSFACSSARRRCSRDLPGTPASALPSDTRAILEPEQAGVKHVAPNEELLRPSTRLPGRPQEPDRSASLIIARPVPNTVSPAKSPVREAEPTLRTPQPPALVAEAARQRRGPTPRTALVLSPGRVSRNVPRT